jgi:hypothetical protein
MGSGPSLPIAHGHEQLSGAGQVGNRSVRRCADATRPLDPGRVVQQYLVGSRLGQPTVRQSIPATVFHQLQLEKRLVHHLAAHLDSQLGSRQWWSMSSAVWLRSGKNHETRIPPGVSHRPVLWQRRPSSWRFAMEHAATNCVPVSQVIQADGIDDVGIGEEAGSAATGTA